MRRRPPIRAVRSAVSFEGPAGATYFDMVLECGHGMWRRAMRPPKRVQCVACWRDPPPPRQMPMFQVDNQFLILASYDELLILWDALGLATKLGDVGDPSYLEIKRLRERVAELLSR